MAVPPPPINQQSAPDVTAARWRDPTPNTWPAPDALLERYLRAREQMPGSPLTDDILYPACVAVPPDSAGSDEECNLPNDWSTLASELAALLHAGVTIMDVNRYMLTHPVEAQQPVWWPIYYLLMERDFPQPGATAPSAYPFVRSMRRVRAVVWADVQAGKRPVRDMCRLGPCCYAACSETVRFGVVASVAQRPTGLRINGAAPARVTDITLFLGRDVSATGKKPLANAGELQRIADSAAPANLLGIDLRGDAAESQPLLAAATLFPGTATRDVNVLLEKGTIRDPTRLLLFVTNDTRARSPVHQAVTRAAEVQRIDAKTCVIVAHMTNTAIAVNGAPSADGRYLQVLIAMKRDEEKIQLLVLLGSVDVTYLSLLADPADIEAFNTIYDSLEAHRVSPAGQPFNLGRIAAVLAYARVTSGDGRGFLDAFCVQEIVPLARGDDNRDYVVREFHRGPIFAASCPDTHCHLCLSHPARYRGWLARGDGRAFLACGACRGRLLQ